jgi:hypothetical protein
VSWLRVVATNSNGSTEDFMLKRLSTLVAAGAFVMLLVPAANAITPAPLPGVSDVIHVADGCGRGWIRNRYGRCVRAGVVVRGPVVIGAPVVVARPVAVCRSVRTAYGWRRVCR